MDSNKIGSAISYLRKRAGYTQKDLADRIGISDKTVSKWERGLGMPDVGYLRKLSILLDTDTDSLLAGDVVNHDPSWRGVLVLDDNEYGIGAGTLLYDKPLINYLLSYYLLVGIKDITVVCSEADSAFIYSAFSNGEEYGIKISTVTGGLKNAVHDEEDGNIMMVYGRCFLYGVDQTRFFQKAMMDRRHFTMLVLPKKITHQDDGLAIDYNMKVINSNTEEPLRTQYDFTDIPILFFPAGILKKMAEDTDIVSFIKKYSVENQIYVQMLDRGFVDIEIDNEENVREASTFIKIVQDKCGMEVYCIEEVAWRRGMITMDQLREHGERQRGTEYGEYILSLIDRVEMY